MSVRTRKTAVSVEWPGRKPDAAMVAGQRKSDNPSADVRRGAPGASTAHISYTTTTI